MALNPALDSRADTAFDDDDFEDAVLIVPSDVEASAADEGADTAQGERIFKPDEAIQIRLDRYEPTQQFSDLFFVLRKDIIFSGADGEAVLQLHMQSPRMLVTAHMEIIAGVSGFEETLKSIVTPAQPGQRRIRRKARLAAKRAKQGKPLSPNTFALTDLEGNRFIFNMRGELLVARIRKENEFTDLVQATILLRAVKEEKAKKHQLATAFYWCAAIPALFAAVKQLQGNYNLGKQWGWSDGLSWGSGAIGAAPAVFFYTDSIYKVLNHFVDFLDWFRQKWSSCCGAGKVGSFGGLKLALPFILKELFGKTEEHAESTWHVVANIILGILYGAANFGMVLEAIAQHPDLIYSQGPLRTIVLTALFFTNTCVGVDKSATFSSSLSALFKTSLQDPRQKLKLQLLELAFDTRIKLEKEIKKRGGPAPETIAEVFAALRRADKITPETILKELEEKNIALQKQLNELLTNPPVGEVYAAIEVGTSNDDAAQKPIYCQVAFSDWAPKSHLTLYGLSTFISGAAVVSNVFGIYSALLWTSVPVIATPWFAIPTAVIGSLSAFGLNLADTNAAAEWIEKKLFMGITASTDDRSRWELVKSNLTPDVLHTIFGWAIAAIGAFSGAYYTEQAFNGWIQNEENLNKVLAFFIEVMKFFCSWVATFSLMTSTKAQPTDRLLRKFSAGIESMLSRCCAPNPRKAKTLTINVELTHYQDKKIELLLSTIRDQVQFFNRELAARKKESPGAKWPEPIDYDAFSKEINGILATAQTSSTESDTPRAKFINKLEEISFKQLAPLVDFVKPTHTIAPLREVVVDGAAGAAAAVAETPQKWIKQGAPAAAESASAETGVLSRCWAGVYAGASSAASRCFYAPDSSYTPISGDGEHDVEKGCFGAWMDCLDGAEAIRSAEEARAELRANPRYVPRTYNPDAADLV